MENNRTVVSKQKGITKWLKIITTNRLLLALRRGGAEAE